jgi:CubicO group peptidase (beta-lactamase class C family)/streptogramin lyase
LHKSTNPKQLSKQIDAYLTKLAAQNQLSGAVLVAGKGKILLAKGYGMAVRESDVPNAPTTRYPIPGVSFSLSLAAGLRLEDQGKLHDVDLVCSDLASCPDSWKAITIGMVLDGTSGLSDAGWGQAGHTPDQSLAHCQGEPLLAAPGTKLSYQNCTVVVLGTIFQKVSGKPWESFMRQEIFRPAGMKNSGRMTDALVPPARAEDYSGSAPDPDVVYNDYFQVYGTIRDVYAYDNALFEGKLLSRRSVQRLFAPRGTVTPPDANITNERQASKWKVATLLGHQVILTTDDTKSFTGANLRFPKEGVTVIVISNDSQNNVEPIAVHSAALLFGAKPPKQPTTPAGPAPTVVDPAKAILARIDIGSIANYPVTTNGSVWLVSWQTGSVIRVDAKSNTVAATIKVTPPPAPPFNDDPDPIALAVVDGQVWVGDRADKTLVRVDPATNTVAGSIRIGIHPDALAVANGSLWAASYDEGTAVRVDLQTQKLVATIHNLQNPNYILATSDAVWIATLGDARVQRIDPATNTIVASIPVGTLPTALAVSSGAVWVVNGWGGDFVSRIDPQTNKVVATVPLGGPAGCDGCPPEIAATDDSVWVVAHSAQQLVRIDPRTNAVTATLNIPTPPGDTGFHLSSLGYGEGGLWLSAPHYLLHIDPQAMKAP